MYNEKLNEIEERLKCMLDAERYHHTLGVMYMSAALAMKHGESVEKALLAGLLHDCAKCMPLEEKLSTAQIYASELNITPFEIEHPHLLHGKLGVNVCRNEFGIEEEDILNAVANHTKGRAGMSLLEKIVYTADFIEPDRDAERIDGMAKIRKTAFEDLDLAVYMIMKRTLEYLNEAGRPVDTDALTAFAFYKDLMETRKHTEVTD